MAAALRAGHHGAMESVLNVRPRQFRALGWAALFPAVMCLCFVCWGARPWTWIAVSAAAAVTLVAPAVAADLLAVALLGFASYAFALMGRNETLPPGSARRPATRSTLLSSVAARRIPSIWPRDC